MTLNAAEVGTPLWNKLVAHYEPKLVSLRARAENPELEEVKRKDLLYQIKFIKDFLALAEPEQKKVTSAS